MTTPFYNHVTSLAKVPSDANYWAILNLLRNPYISLDNAYRELVGDGGTWSEWGDNAEVRSNEILEEVNFGNGVWVYKYTTEEFPRREAVTFYVPMYSRKLEDGSYSHWVIEGPVDTLPKALKSALDFITSGISKDVAKSNTN